MTDEIIAVDLFCGAGGFSEGLRQACEDLGYDLRHAAINHDEDAIASHELNHPDAHQYHSKVEQLHPPNVIDDLVEDDVTDVHADDVSVDLLVAGPECTHFSNARGGKPVSEQKRMSPWYVLDYVEKLDVDAFLIENVGEIQSWGPVEDGQPTRDGSVFKAWINVLNELGYSVEWTTLNAADYGDPTSRERFFLVGRQGGKATFPTPTHSDDDDDLPDRRTAAEIIDWSDLGESIWTRDLTEPRVHTPPKDSTMERIAEGIRRHCDDRLEPFADALEQLGRPEIRTLREERVVDAEYADIVAKTLDEPFLVRVPAERFVPATPQVLGQHSNSVARDVSERPAQTVAKRGNIHLSTAETCLVKYYGTSPPQSIDAPLDTVTANGHKYAVSTTESVLLRQQDGGAPWAVRDRPMPTIPTKGAHAIATPSLIEPKNGQYRGLHSNPLYRPENQPIHTVTADPRAKLVSPSLLRWSHGGAALSFDDPMPTIATERGGVYSLSAPVVQPFLDNCQGPAQSLTRPLKTQPASDRYALCVPELWPWGLDVKYRMLQPRELKQAQGFPPDYDLVGNKESRTTQIGNAVPVNLAKTLCEHVLTAEDPSLASFGGGIERDANVEIPDYEEVASSDD